MLRIFNLKMSLCGLSRIRSEKDIDNGLEGYWFSQMQNNTKYVVNYIKKLNILKDNMKI